MEADKRALTLDVQQQHQRLILHQALFFGRSVRNKSGKKLQKIEEFPKRYQQHNTAVQNLDAKWCASVPRLVAFVDNL